MHTPPSPGNETNPAANLEHEQRADAPSPLAALTSRQYEVATLVATGMTNRMIASHLGIAEWTVVNHLRQVMQRLECPSRLHVALIVERESRTTPASDHRPAATPGDRIGDPGSGGDGMTRIA